MRKLDPNNPRRGFRFRPNVKLNTSQIQDRRSKSMEGRFLPPGKAWPSRYSDVYQMQDYMRGHGGAAQMLVKLADKRRKR